MIVITGAAGFIGSALVAHLNENKILDAVLVDNFETPFRFRNLSWKHYQSTIERSEMQIFLSENYSKIEAIIHLGGKSGYLHDHWHDEQLEFIETHQYLWKFCADQEIPFIYASSGAVYGNGDYGFQDDDDTTHTLKCHHPYAQMRLEVDRWSLLQELQPPKWAALRMSNVYGPNEYHKMSNASLVYKAYNEILSYNSMRLFASDRPDVENGGMTRDYIYVKDVVKVILHFLKQPFPSGIYNVSTGVGTSFKEVCDLVFKELMISPRYEFEPILEVLKSNFPYFVQLPNSKLLNTGYHQEMYTIEKGTKDYINKYLLKGEFY